MSAAPPLVLALDVGTGSVRAHLPDAEGSRMASAGRSLPVALGADARAEIDTDAVWAAACAVLRDVLAQRPPHHLAALAVASGLGYVLLDRDGSPLGRRTPSVSGRCRPRLPDRRGQTVEAEVEELLGELGGRGIR